VNSTLDEKPILRNTLLLSLVYVSVVAIDATRPTGSLFALKIAVELVHGAVKAHTKSR
jgi:hypothetical protein